MLSLTQYPFFVEYIENGVLCSDVWSENTLNTELNRNEVKIVNVSLRSALVD